mmetsp:Transcript_12804/g.40176  ORF Transcript_12804/g.40176 Transcript_12804/m.40176 type:complete len:276 (-) Transcript_12804:417-1244(-)
MLRRVVSCGSRAGISPSLVAVRILSLPAAQGLESTLRHHDLTGNLEVAELVVERTKLGRCIRDHRGAVRLDLRGTTGLRGQEALPATAGSAIYVSRGRARAGLLRLGHGRHLATRVRRAGAPRTITALLSEAGVSGFELVVPPDRAGWQAHGLHRHRHHRRLQAAVAHLSAAHGQGSSNASCSPNACGPQPSCGYVRAYGRDARASDGAPCCPQGGPGCRATSGAHEAAALSTGQCAATACASHGARNRADEGAGDDVLHDALVDARPGPEAARQ